MGKIKPRKKYYIHKIQKKYLILTFVSLIAYTTITALLLFLPSTIDLYFAETIDAKVKAANEFLILDARIWPFLTLTIILFGLISIFVTHKFAGPLYRFEKSFQKAIGGDLTIKINLRKNDDLKELVNYFNQFVDVISHKFMKIKDINESEIKGLKEITDNLKKNANNDNIHNDLSKVLKGKEEIKEILDTVKLNSD